jgi:hypothetical protein
MAGAVRKRHFEVSVGLSLTGASSHRPALNPSVRAAGVGQ